MNIQGWNVAGKAWTGLIGAVLAFAAPAVLQTSTNLPEPWPAVIAAVIAVMTWLGAYKAPYNPAPGSSSGSNESAATPWPTE